MRWQEFEARQPALASVGAQKLTGPGVLMGTARRDGSPRISPVEPLLWVGLVAVHGAGFRQGPRTCAGIPDPGAQQRQQPHR
jgi:hypothetical protein